MTRPAQGPVVHRSHAGQEDQREGHAEQRVRQHAELDQWRQCEDRERLERQQEARADA